MKDSSSPSIEILYLAEMPEAIDTLAQLFVEEWAPYYGPDGPGDAVADLSECLSHKKLPIALVAIDQTGLAVGTAALKTHSLGDEWAPGPWLAAWVVAKKRRGQGIGTALLYAVEKMAGAMGYTTIYTSSDKMGTMLRANEWRHIADSQSLRGPVSVFERRLTEQTD